MTQHSIKKLFAAVLVLGLMAGAVFAAEAPKDKVLFQAAEKALLADVAGPPGAVAPAFLEKILPAVVRIKVDQPAWERGRWNLNRQRPNGQRQFQFRIDPNNGDWRPFLEPFLQKEARPGQPPRPPRFLPVQPPDDEAEEGEENPPDVLQFALPRIEIQQEDGDQRILVLPGGRNQFQIDAQPFPWPDGARFNSEVAGCLVRPDGFIVAAPGSTFEGAEKIEVTLYDGRKFEATVAGRDNLEDLAVLKIQADQLPTIPIGDSDAVKVGETIYTIGHPYGFAHTVSQGIVSGLNRTLPQGARPKQGLLQLDVPFAPGCSGGPVINARGEVIGLNYALFTPAGGGVPLSFALPINRVMKTAEALIERGEAPHAWLGVQIGPLDEDKRKGLNVPDLRGALVMEVMENSPAKAAGLEVFDVVRRIGEREITTPNDLIAAIGEHQPGEEVQVEVWRQNQAQTLTVKLGQMPQEVMAQVQPEGNPPRPPKITVQVPRTGRQPRPPQPPRGRTQSQIQIQGDGETLSLNVTGAPLHEVIQNIARVTKRNLAVDAHVQDRPITIKIEKKPVQEALELLLRANNLELVEVGDWAIVREVPKEE